MLLNLDIWREIMNYFEPSQRHVPPVLRALAVTSRCLSTLALDVIWRRGETISALISVINSFAHSPNEPFLEYVDLAETDSSDSSDGGDSAGTWVSSSRLSFLSQNKTQCPPGAE